MDQSLLGIVARPERFERPTPWFVAKYSIQLSYGRFVFLKPRILRKQLTHFKHFLQIHYT